MNIKVTVDDFSMVHGFKTFKKANEMAVRNTLNKAAGFTRNEAIKEIKKDFTLRNSFVVRSIVFNKATQSDISKMQSSTGALKRASFMKTQEEGGFRRNKMIGDSEGSVRATSGIPMDSVRSGKSKSGVVEKEKYIQKIKGRFVKGEYKKKNMTPKSRTVASFYIAKKYGLYINRGKSIFSVKSFSQIGPDRISAELELTYSIHKGAIKVPKRAWLQPSVNKASRNLEAVYRWELKRLWKEGNFK